jgi:hypothetical protein
MWYLLAEAGAAPILGQIESRKKNISETMTPEEMAEAARRAGEWLSNAKKNSGFAGGAEAATENSKKRAAGN